MFISNARTYYESDGTQRAARAPFLILASSNTPQCAPDCERPGHVQLYAVVRKVALSQFGNFMMGRARVGNHSIVISGAFGSDGLPIDYERELTPRARDFFIPVPSDIAHAYWTDDQTAHDQLRHWARAVWHTQTTRQRP